MVAFGRLAEICGDYLHKGSKVYIEGQLRTRKWQDQGGADRYTTEIVARDMQMLDSGPAARGDEATLAAHRATLEERPDLASLYDAWTRRIQTRP